MTVTLCIETSSVYCSLALAVEDQVFCRHEELQRRHNEEVLPLLDALYQEAGVAPRETGLIGFGAGPGSFTGVRIAASIAQGLAMASECLVVPMAGSEILLHSALAEPSLSAALASSSAEATKTWLTVVPSRAEAYYLALYSHSREDGAEVITAVHEDRLYTQTPEWLKAGQQPCSLAGPRPLWLSEGLIFDQTVDPAPNAQAMVLPVRHAHSLGHSQPAQDALPIYVEGDSPWKKVASVAAPNR
ncbi:MAG: tRNA (adenosine(37)-N6)-threonylcarbamoyltransferase complex dimerization subunit type 1 TsaB [Gammaproteobacteria bacterium]|jgi:tRNA threonylcarbamoyladenosine biosynthesis protein TsaB